MVHSANLLHFSANHVDVSSTTPFRCFFRTLAAMATMLGTLFLAKAALLKKASPFWWLSLKPAVLMRLWRSFFLQGLLCRRAWWGMARHAQITTLRNHCKTKRELPALSAQHRQPPRIQYKKTPRKESAKTWLVYEHGGQPASWVVEWSLTWSYQTQSRPTVPRSSFDEAKSRSGKYDSGSIGSAGCDATNISSAWRFLRWRWCRWWHLVKWWVLILWGTTCIS